MRTTLTIDDDVLAAAKALAERQQRNIGAVVSELARSALNAPAATPPARPWTADSFPGLPKRGLKQPITNEFINQLREELGV